jgi:hypothetical protein
MGSKSTQNQQSQTTNTLDPWVKGLLSTNVAQAGAVADQPFQAFGGESVAPFTGAQIQGQGMLSNLATDPTLNGANTLSSAISAAQASSGYKPMQVTPTTATSEGYAPTSYNASLLDPNQIQSFMDPYLGTVVKNTVDASNLALSQQENQNNAQFNKAGAWRGSAIAVQNANAQGLSNTGLDTAVGNLENTGWNTAAGLASGNVDRTNTAAAANAGAANTAAQFGASAANAAAEANATRGMTAQQTNQAAGLTANQQNQAASTLLANQSAQQLTQGQSYADLLTGVGATQQAQTQAQDTFNYNQYLAERAYPAQQQAIRNAALGLVPATTNSASTGSSTSTTDPGIAADIGTAISDASKLAQAGMMMSDERIKKDVTTAGWDRRGRRWVDFRYKTEHPAAPKHRGLLAQETLRTDPHAVGRLPAGGGLLGVDYGKLAA